MTDRLETMRAIGATLAKGLDSLAHPAWSKDDLKKIDAWIKGQDDPKMGRSEAVRRLVELGLKAKAK